MLKRRRRKKRRGKRKKRKGEENKEKGKVLPFVPAVVEDLGTDPTCKLTS